MPSIEQIQRLLAAEPEDTFLLYALAQEQAKGGDLAAAIATYDRVLALDPGHGYAYFHKARAQEQSGTRPALRRPWAPGCRPPALPGTRRPPARSPAISRNLPTEAAPGGQPATMSATEGAA